MCEVEKRWHIPSATKPGVEYEVTYTPGALLEWFCECLGFHFRGTCRHVKLCMNEHEAGKLTMPMFGEDSDGTRSQVQ